MVRMYKQKDEATGITYSLWIDQDWIPRSGEFYENEPGLNRDIRERLDDGDIWAWADVTVRAQYEDFKGESHLGGCCYRDTAEFMQDGGYWKDMKSEARAEMLKSIERTLERATAAHEHFSGGELTK